MSQVSQKNGFKWNVLWYSNSPIVLRPIRSLLQISLIEVFSPALSSNSLSRYSVVTKSEGIISTSSSVSVSSISFLISTIESIIFRILREKLPYI